LIITLHLRKVEFNDLTQEQAQRQRTAARVRSDKPFRLSALDARRGAAGVRATNAQDRQKCRTVSD
jgi:hypothetical protein